MKKIISYSIWGDDPKYLDGALANIENQKKLYPSWICRFYIHDQVPKYFMEFLNNKKVEIIKKSGDLGIAMNKPGMFWRFEVMKDPEVERFIVRDADSRLTQREKNCVLDWKLSGKNFHIIRDNIHHSTKIMGGMWGATREFCKTIDYDKLVEDFNKIEQKSIYGTDQDFLAQFIYPLIKEDCLIHDDWDRYGEGARKIPHIRIKNEYIGQPIEL
jgi:protein O-GlcNAc transferase